MLVFSPVNLVLNNMVGKEISFFVYYLLAMGAPFAIANVTRNKRTGINQYEMNIWNRWGELIFESNNPQEAWNGRKYNQGKSCPNGLYICLVKFVGPRGKAYEFREFALLIR